MNVVFSMLGINKYYNENNTLYQIITDCKQREREREATVFSVIMC